MSGPKYLTGDKAGIANFVDQFDIFLFDCDGVLWSGDHIFPGVVDTLDMLRSRGKRVIFVTNNSTKSRDDYKKKLGKMGIEAARDDIFASAYSSAVYIKRILKLPEGRNKVFVIGEQGIEDELELEGVDFIGGTDPDLRRDIKPEDFARLAKMEELQASEPEKHRDNRVGVVLAGLDFHINYLKLATAFQYLNAGAVFLATNLDSTLPMNGVFFPGAGSVSSVALANMLASRVGPEASQPTPLGKPSQEMMRAMMDVLEAQQEGAKLDRSRICMVGDRLDTDIRFGIEGGLGGTLAVLTGVCNPGQWQAEGAEVVPKYYADKLSDLLAAKDSA